VALYRFKRAKNEKKLEPGEYAPADYEKLLLAVDPNLGTEWRIWGILALIGQHGIRIHAARKLRFTDATAEQVTWPGEFQKNGEPLVQSVTWETWSVLETARYWHRKLGIKSEWVFPGTLREGERQPYTYDAAHKALIKAELRAGVEHEPYRAFHGGRRTVVTTITDETGDARLAMQYVGDRDLKQLPSYLKMRDSRSDRASAVMSNVSPKASPNRPPSARRGRIAKSGVGSDDSAGTSGEAKEPLVGFEPTTATTSDSPHSSQTASFHNLEANNPAPQAPKGGKPSSETVPKPSPVTGGPTRRGDR
jgi:hypothetical protein